MNKEDTFEPFDDNNLKHVEDYDPWDDWESLDHYPGREIDDEEWFAWRRMCRVAMAEPCHGDT